MVDFGAELPVSSFSVSLRVSSRTQEGGPRNNNAQKDWVGRGVTGDLLFFAGCMVVSSTFNMKA